MSLKVTKKGKKFAVVKDTYWEEWYVVDVASGTKVKEHYSASSAKWTLEKLESGFYQPEDFITKWNDEYGKPIDMPASLKKMQQELLDPKPKKAKAQKPIGSTSTSIKSVEDKGFYKLLEMDDGTFGVYVPATGESTLGIKNRNGAARSAKAKMKKAATARLSEMGVDAGSDSVDTLLRVYEDRMRAMYGEAARDMSKKEAEALRAFSERKLEMQERVRSGAMSKSDYDAWLRGQASTAKWYGDMTESLSQDLVAADAKAMDMLNGYVPRAYAENMNFATFQIEDSASISTGFTLYNESTVARLIANPEGSLLPDLPQAKIDELKDSVWSKQKISSCVTQSILQGESVDDAAKRLRRVVGMGANSAMRAARTTLTAAQNLGRLDAGRRARAMGIELKKQWIATADARTRYSHREIDRETVELDEEFSNGCDCPAHGGPPHEVYNCRCAMRYVLPDHEYDDLPDKTREGVEYDKWKNEHMTKMASSVEGLKKQLDEANANIGDLKKMLPPDKDFGKIVQGGAKASQWTEEKVASSEEFYFGKLQKAIAENNSFDIDWYKKRLAELKEFDDAGRAYHEAHKLVDSQLARWEKVAADAKQKIKEFNLKNGIRDPYSVEWFKTSEEADKALRRWTGDAWRTAGDREKNAINRYTGGEFNEYNRPLNGYDGRTYSPSNFVGVGNADIDRGGYGGAIRGMTKYLEQSVTEEDMWLRRGEGDSALAPFFGLPAGTSISSMDDDELRAFIGTSGRIGSFQSCGTTAATGFTHKPIAIEYFVPAGSQAAYVEPFSKCGWGEGIYWDGISEQSGLGGELETILQRGGSYTLIDYRREGGKPTFVMEVHPEDGYWTFQQEETI